MQKVSIAVVTRKDGKVLVISRRKKESGTDNSILTWTFPSGTVENGETPNDTVIRETLEETGYKIKPVLLINEKDHPQFPVHVYYWACELVNDIQHKLKGSDEITEVRWVDPDKIFTLFTTNLDSKTAIYLGVNSKMS